MFTNCLHEPDLPLTEHIVVIEAGDQGAVLWVVFCAGDRSADCNAVSHDRRPGASRVNKNKIKNDMNAPSLGDRAPSGPPPEGGGRVGGVGSV